MSDLSRLLDERLDERIISAINDLDISQFQQLVANLLKSMGVVVTSKEELGDAVLFRGEGDSGAFVVMASRLFDHASIGTVRRVKSLAEREKGNAVIMLTNDMDADAKALADKEGVSYADKKRFLLLLRKYQLADALMQEIDRRVLEAEGDRALPSAGRFDQLITAAIEHMGKGRFKDAIYNLDRALEIKPGNDQVWQFRANALFNLGRLEEAIDSCRKATELRPADATSWYLMAMILDQMEDFEESVKAYDTVLKLQPGNRSALLNKGTALYRMGKLEKAIKAFDQLLKAYPADVMAQNNKGIVLKASGRTKEALEAFQKAAIMDRNYINPVINMALIHTESGQHEMAIEDWKRALQLERRRPDILLSLASSYRETGDLDSAFGAVTTALEIDPDMKEAQAMRDELEDILFPPAPNKPEAAGPAPEEVPDAEPAEVTPAEEKPEEQPKAEEAMLPAVIEGEKLPAEIEAPGAVACMPEPGVPVKVEEAGAVSVVEEPKAPAKIEEPGAVAVAETPSVPAKVEEPGAVANVEAGAIAVKEEAGAVAEVPRNEIVPVAEAPVVAIERPGALAEAEPVKIVTEAPVPEKEPEETMDPLRRHLLTVKFMMMVGDLQQAMTEVDRALAEHPGEASLIRLKASVLAALGKYDAALAVMSDLYAKERDERVLYDIESISFVFGQRKEGMQILSKMRPTKESVARQLSSLLDAERNDELMLDAPKTKHPSELSSASQALVLMKKGRYRDAAKIWKGMLERFPADAEGLNNLGVCMRFMGEYGYDEPIKFMLLATLVDPMYSDAFNNVGCVYFAAGGYDLAIENLSKAIAIDRKPEYYLNLSNVQLAIGDVAGAKDSLASALKLEESPEVLYLLAVIAEKEGDLKWAYRLYEDAIAAKPDFKDAIFNLQRVKLQLKFSK